MAAADVPPLPIFTAPYDWSRVDAAVASIGGVILSGFMDRELLRDIDEQLDRYLEANVASGRPNTGSESYDDFLGHRTIRLHGLIEKAPRTADLIGHPDLVEWADRTIEPSGRLIAMNAAELIEIQPNEPRQMAHRDSDSWPEAPRGEHPIVVNAIIALDPFTLENGATYIAPGSWQWEPRRRAKANEYTRAVMNAGDAVLFRGDLIHRGGENLSAAPRRAISISYCAGWLRPVENSFLNLPIATVAGLPPRLQAILGYQTNHSAPDTGGLLGLYENGEPAAALGITPRPG